MKTDAKTAQEAPAKKMFAEDELFLGKAFVNALAILLKTAQIHEVNNVALDAPTENLKKMFEKVSGWGDPDLSLQGENLYLGGMKVKMDIECFMNFIFLIEELKKRRVGTIRVDPSVSTADLRRFAKIFVTLDPKGTQFIDSLGLQMAKAGISTIFIEPLPEKPEVEDIAELLKDRKEISKRTYSKTLNAVSEVMDSVKLRQTVSVKKAKRVVQEMVDQILQEESNLIGLTSLRCHDEYTHNHSVNVCVLSLVIGQRLGYSKRKLSELGLAALFHDIGKSEIPLEVLNKPAEFDEHEWKVMRRHPIFSVKLLVKLKGLNELAVRVMLGAFEHHLNYDLSGYPKLVTKRNLTVFGRIISIADCYDALTSSRVYNRTPYPPDRALKFMLNKMGTAFDPLLMKIFVNAIGIYPIGTLVLLDTHEIGVICQTNPNPDKLDRPKVRIVCDPAGNAVDGDVIDLSETIDGTDRYARSVVRTIDARKYKINVDQFFL